MYWPKQSSKGLRVVFVWDCWNAQCESCYIGTSNYIHLEHNVGGTAFLIAACFLYDFFHANDLIPRVQTVFGNSPCILPNTALMQIGKSTLFNALTNSSLAAAENYPFCTIEPNKAKVPVPDPRLHQLGAIAESQKIIEAQLEFVDIAGLVKGASEVICLYLRWLHDIA